MGSCSLLQGIFPTQGSKLCLPHCKQILYCLSHQGNIRTRIGSLSLLQGIFPTQELNQDLLHCRQILYQLSYQGSYQGSHKTLSKSLTLWSLPFPCLVQVFIFSNQRHPRSLHYLDPARQRRAGNDGHQNLLPATTECWRSQEEF